MSNSPFSTLHKWQRGCSNPATPMARLVGPQGTMACGRDLHDAGGGGLQLAASMPLVLW